MYSKCIVGIQTIPDPQDTFEKRCLSSLICAQEQKGLARQLALGAALQQI